MRPIIVAIKTYNRPKLLMNLLRDIDRESPRSEFKVIVFDDGSDKDYTEAIDFCRERDWEWMPFQVNHGKKRAWELVNAIFKKLAREGRVEHFYFLLDDDTRLCRRFFKRAMDVWGSIQDGRKVSLHLMVDKSRMNRTCWTGVVAKRINEDATLTQWVDGSFMCERSFFLNLNWRVKPIKAGRWAKDPTVSTGVGAQISKRLVKRNKTLYQVANSLVVHTVGDSKYNPDIRHRHPLETVNFVDGESDKRLLSKGDYEPVQVSLATIPSRAESLKRVLEALYDQADVIRVYLNGWDLAPSYLDDKRFVVATSQQHGDRGDAGKFFWCEEAQGYQIICDDDLAYPYDYTKRMVAAIDRYKRKVVVGVHGVKLNEPMLSYYSSRYVQHFSMGLRRDSVVHMLGTGCMGYHASALKIRKADFERPNMADIWMGLLCQDARVPMVCIERGDKWITPLPTADSIYDRTKDCDEVQTEAVRRVWPWRLQPLPA